MGSAAWQTAPHFSSATNLNHRRYDLVDGVVQTNTLAADTRRPVPAEISRIAMRVTIAEGMSEKGQPISLVIDDALEGLPIDVQQAAVGYLAGIAGDAQQVVLLTADTNVADLAKSHHAWTCNMQPETVTSVDPNRHLMALANDHEADKWYQPGFSRTDYRGTRNQFFLSDASLIEDLPAIDPDLAARCRAVGVDRIGDLLDVDPLWLADQIKVAGVSKLTVEAWQSVANLLCNIPNLRPFDARVIVGAGIRTPDQLARMHPSQLLDRVERFLTTDQGRKILRSGNSYELSRITAWIASAKGGPVDHDYADGYEPRYDHDHRRSYGSDRSSSRGYRARSRSSDRSYPVISRSGTRSERSYREREDRDYTRRERSRRSRDYEPREYERSRYEKQPTTRVRTAASTGRRAEANSIEKNG